MRIEYVLASVPLLAFYFEHVHKTSRVQLLFIHLWSWVDDIQIVRLGQVEANICLSTFDRAFGATFASLHRILSTLCFFFISSMFYLVVTTQLGGSVGSFFDSFFRYDSQGVFGR
jgi:hypothetical protein